MLRKFQLSGNSIFMPDLTDPPGTIICHCPIYKILPCSQEFPPKKREHIFAQENFFVNFTIERQAFLSLSTFHTWQKADFQKKNMPIFFIEWELLLRLHLGCERDVLLGSAAAPCWAGMSVNFPLACRWIPHLLPHRGTSSPPPPHPGIQHLPSSSVLRKERNWTVDT